MGVLAAEMKAPLCSVCLSSKMAYPYLAKTLPAFIHRLVTGYMVHGYHFYVTGRHPDRFSEAELLEADRRMIKKFGCDRSYRTRVRRKRAGLTNCHYMRFRSDWILVATRGLGSPDGELHPFFFEHREVVGEGGLAVRKKEYRDFRERALYFHGYSISLRWEGARPKGRNGRKLPPDRTTKRRGSVRIHPGEYLALKSYFVDLATRRSVANLTELLQSIPFEPYAPIRIQLLAILKAVNKARRQAGFDEVPRSALRLKRTRKREMLEVLAA